VLGGSPERAVAAGRVAAMLQQGGLPIGATVAELVGFVRRLYPRRLPLAEVLELAGLTDLARRRTERLSGGQEQRLRFALAIAGNPELAFLDEPTTGMDVEARHAFWDRMRAFAAQGRTVLFATHYLEEADAVARWCSSAATWWPTGRSPPSRPGAAAGWFAARCPARTPEPLAGWRP
jgi:ABC-2 type transport system ATP-binding protein